MMQQCVQCVKVQNLLNDDIFQGQGTTRVLSMYHLEHILVSPGPRKLETMGMKPRQGRPV